MGGTLPINLAASGQHYSHQQTPYQPQQQQHIDANPSSTNNRVVQHPLPPPKSVTYSSQKQVAAGGGGGIPTVSQNLQKKCNL